jgi:hypothetical protein
MCFSSIVRHSSTKADLFRITIFLCGRQFPVVGHAGVAKDESDQILETGLSANIVRKDNDTTLTGLDAYHRVGGLTVVSAFVEAMTLRAVKDDYTEPSVQILALFVNLQIGNKGWKLVGSSALCLPSMFDSKLKEN